MDSNGNGKIDQDEIDRIPSFIRDRMKERGVCKPEHVSMAKRNNCEIALEIARRARDIHGANGITSEYPIMRHMNNLESVKTYEGTHNIHTLVLGENITGIAAYRG